MTPLGEDFDKLNELARETLSQLRALAKAHNGHSVGNITINAGGIGVWIAATCCAVMLASLLVLAIVGAAAYTDMRSDIRRLNDSDNALRAYIHTGVLTPMEQDDEEE